MSLESLEPSLYLLLSADIIDSTKRKYEQDKDSWYKNLKIFYSEFSQSFYINYKAASGNAPENHVMVWKLVGDEILFYVKINDSQDARQVVYSFAETIRNYNDETDSDVKENSRNKIKVKGTVWAAQTPFIDRTYNATNLRADFVGPSVDCGFRIGKLSTQDRIAVSMDVAVLCLEKGRDVGKFEEQFQVTFGKMEMLKGVFGGRTEYPVFFVTEKNKIAVHEKTLNSFTDEDQLNGFIDAFIEKISGDSDIASCISKITFPVAEYLESKKQLSSGFGKPDEDTDEISVNGKINDRNEMSDVPQNAGSAMDQMTRPFEEMISAFEDYLKDFKITKNDDDK